MALETNLQHHFRLEENAGTNRVDSHGGVKTLAPAGSSVSNIAGKIDNANDFQQSDYLVANDSTVADFTTENFTISFWIRFDAFPVVQAVPVSKWITAGRQWQFDYLTSTSRFRFLVRNAADTANVTVSANNFGAPSINTWYFVQLQKTSTVISIRVNNGTADTLAHTEDLPSQTTKFALGKRDGDATSFEGGAFNGKIDEVSIWDTDKSTTDLNTIYNSGAGLSWPWLQDVSPAISNFQMQTALWKRGGFSGTVHQQSGDSNVSGYVRQTFITKDESAEVASDRETFVRYLRNYYTIPPTNYFQQYRIRCDFEAGKTFNREDGLRYYGRLYKDNQTVNVDGPCVVNSKITHSYIHPNEDFANEVMTYSGKVDGIDSFSIRFMWMPTFAFTDVESDIELARVESDANNYVALKLVAGDRLEREYNRNDVYGPHNPLLRLEKVRGGSVTATADVGGMYFGNTLAEPDGEAVEDFIQITFTHHSASGIFLRVDRNGVVGEGSSTEDLVQFNISGVADLKYTGIGYYGRPESVQEDIANKNRFPTLRSFPVKNMHAIKRVYGKFMPADTSGDGDPMAGQIVRNMVYRETETFNRADSGSLGSDWGIIKETGNGWGIESNQAICETEGFRYWSNRFPAHKDYIVQGKITMGNNGSIIGFLLRWDQDGISSQDEIFGYGVELIQNTSSTANIRVVRFYNGSREILDTTLLSSFGQNTQIVMRATLNGSTVTGEVTTVTDPDFESPLATATSSDSNFTKPGRVGIYGETGGTGQKVWLDDFSVSPNFDTITL